MKASEMVIATQSEYNQDPDNLLFLTEIAKNIMPITEERDHDALYSRLNKIVGAGINRSW